MSEVPVGWSYIQCPSRQDHVLTVSSMSMKVTYKKESKIIKTQCVMHIKSHPSE